MRFNIRKKGAHRLIAVHREVARVFINNPLGLPCVNHINGDRSDNRVNNLQWVTYEENNYHAAHVVKKLRARGRAPRYAAHRPAQVKPAIPLAEKNEVWRPVLGFEKRLLVSTAGRVFNTQKGGLSSFVNCRGYVGVRVNSAGRTRRLRVHRLIARAFIPNPENKPFVNHKNGVRHDNRLENLEWCTPKENTDHARKVLGRRPEDKTRGKPKPKAWRAVVAVCPKTMEERHFAYIGDAAKFIGHKQTVSIHQVCKGVNTVAGEFYWRFADDLNWTPRAFLRAPRKRKPHGRAKR